MLKIVKPSRKDLRIAKQAIEALGGWGCVSPDGHWRPLTDDREMWCHVTIESAEVKLLWLYAEMDQDELLEEILQASELELCLRYRKGKISLWTTRWVGELRIGFGIKQARLGYFLARSQEELWSLYHQFRQGQQVILSTP